MWSSFAISTLNTKTGSINGKSLDIFATPAKLYVCHGSYERSRIAWCNSCKRRKTLNFCIKSCKSLSKACHSQQPEDSPLPLWEDQRNITKTAEEKVIWMFHNKNNLIPSSIHTCYTGHPIDLMPWESVLSFLLFEIINVKPQKAKSKCDIFSQSTPS